MTDSQQPPRQSGLAAMSPAADRLTYTILVREFSSTVHFSGDADRQPVLISLELQVVHPGREFPDDIAAVMSYEDIVEGLRSLCKSDDIPDAADLGERALELCMTYERVLAARAEVILPENRNSLPTNLSRLRQSPN